MALKRKISAELLISLEGISCRQVVRLIKVDGNVNLILIILVFFSRFYKKPLMLSKSSRCLLSRLFMALVWGELLI